jgi:hypothetical protein
MIVVPVDDVGFPRQILRTVRYNDALITQNLGASPQQRCKDGNFVTATPQAQCEIDCHNLGAGTPTQGTVCCKHAHLKPYQVHHATLRGLSSRGLRPVVIQRPPQNVLLVKRRVWLWRMFHEAVCRRRSRIVGEHTRHWRDAIIRGGEPYDGDTTAANRIAFAAVITRPRRLAAVRRPRPRLLAVRDGASGGDRSDRDRYRSPA